MHTGSIYGDSRRFHRQPVTRPSWQTCDDKKTNPASYSASVSRFVDSPGGGNGTWNETRWDGTRREATFFVRITVYTWIAEVTPVSR